MESSEFIKLLSFKPINKIYDSYDEIDIFEFHLRNSDKHISNIEFPKDNTYVYLEILDLTNYIDGTIISNKNARMVHYLKWLKTGSDDEYKEISNEINKLMSDYHTINKGVKK